MQIFCGTCSASRLDGTLHGLTKTERACNRCVRYEKSYGGSAGTNLIGYDRLAAMNLAEKREAAAARQAAEMSDSGHP